MDQRKENRPKKRRPGWAALCTAGAVRLLWLRWGRALPWAARDLLRTGASRLWALPSAVLGALAGLLGS